MSSHLVKPKEPTILSHKEYHEISSANLLLFMTVRHRSQMTCPEVTLTPGLVEQIPTVHVIPEVLDIERFDVALSDALSSYPLFAGRLVRPDTPDTPWKVRPYSLFPFPQLTTEFRFG